MASIRGRLSKNLRKAPFGFRGRGALLRNIVEDAAVPTFLVNAAGELAYANRAFSDLLAYEPSECVGLGIDKIVHPDDRALASAQFEDVIDGTVAQYKGERRYLRSDGSSVWVLVSAAEMLNLGDSPFFMWVQAFDVDRQKRAEAAISENEERWNFALESAGQGVWDHDIPNDTIYYSRMWKLMRGFGPDEFVDTAPGEWLKRVHPDDRERIEEIIRNQTSGAIQRNEFEFRERHQAGHYIWVFSNSAPVEWAADGTPARIIGTDTDVTPQKIAEHDMARLSRRLELALDASQIGVFEGNLVTGELFWDDRLHDIYGIPRDRKSLLAADWAHALHPDDARDATRAITRAIRKKGSVKIKFRIVRPDAEIRTVISRGTYFQSDHAAPKFVGANWDVTADVALEQRLQAAKELAEARNVELESAKARIEDQSLHDALTGLPNRRYLDQFLNKYPSLSVRSGYDFALLHIDLDRFKQINDTLGHLAGDAMLVHVARLLTASAGVGNFVARVGGDEFILVCVNERDTTRLADLAERIIAQICQPVPYDGHLCRFGASIGIAIETDDRNKSSRVMINADVALYRAKHRGGHCYEFFSKALQDEIESKKRIADDILRGIEQREFLPYYQPLVDAKTFDVVGVEALVRWNHPTEGILSPACFLDVAEDLNVLASIDRDILERALTDLDHWTAMNLTIPSVSVNVSFRRLSDDQLVPSLRKLKIKPGTISFELVESIFLDEFKDIVAWNIDAIKEMGIGIDVDDFGTGHTSFVGLLKLNPRRFKIDRQLIAPIAQMPEQRRLIASIIDIGKTLGIKVVAEGVETMEQAHILKELGCDILQGHAFARPMPANLLISWIKAEPSRHAS